MAKRKFVNIERHGTPRLSQYEQHFTSSSFVAYTKTSRPWPEKIEAKWKRQMGRSGRQGLEKALIVPQRNGENDAVSITCVLDLLLRIETDVAIHTAGFTKLLNEEYGHLVLFDPYTVGRIFTGLLDAASDAMVRKANADPAKPLDRLMQSGARFLVVLDHSHENRWWLGNAREVMGRRAERDIALLKGWQGTPDEIMPSDLRKESVWTELEKVPFHIHAPGGLAPQET